MTAAILTLVVGIALTKVLFRSISSFNYGRARTLMRSPTGRNAAAVLAAWSVAELGITLSEMASGTTTRMTENILAVLIVALVIGFVVALATVEKETGFVLAVVGIGAGVADTYLEHGPVGVFVLLILVMMAVWVLGFTRGLL